MSNRYEGFRDWPLRKGNLHVHSTLSDGGKTREELIAMYREAGYDFLAFTDHSIFSDASKLSTPDFLCVDGVEMHGRGRDGTGVHVVAVAPRRPIQNVDQLEAGLDDAVDAGAFIFLAHPHWCGNSFDIFDDPRYAALEVYNEVCEDICSKGHAGSYWDWALATGRPLLGVAVDDAHLHGPYQTYAQAWVRVKAEQLTSEAIADSLHAGLFYSSFGPEFIDIDRHGDELIVRTSPVRAICAVGARGKGRRDRDLPPGQPMTEAHIDVSAWDDDDPADYLRIEIVDADGRRAWTNTL